MTHSEYNTGRPAGRPSRLNPAVVTNLLNVLSGGAYVTTACQFAGIAPSSYSLWRRRGEAEYERLRAQGVDPEALLQEISTGSDGKTLAAGDILKAGWPGDPWDRVEYDYAVFLFHSERALAASEVRNLTMIQSAASESWQASAWLLERRHPDRWGRRERINLEGSKEGAPVKIEHVSVDELEATIARLKGEEDG